MSRNEFDPQDVKISVDDYKIYKIEGCEIPITALQAGATSSMWSTLVEPVRRDELINLKHRILAVLLPQDV